MNFITILESSNELEIEQHLRNNTFPSHLSPTIVVDLSHEFTLKIDNIDVKFLSSNNCLIPYFKQDSNVKYLFHMRCVNYKINSDGRFTIYPNHSHLQGKLITVNKYFLLDENFKVLEIHLFDSLSVDKEFNGVEDIRLFYDNDQLIYTGVTLHPNNKIGIVSGKYNFNSSKLSYDYLTQNFQTLTTEKNWILYNFNNELRVIYKFYPLTICSLQKSIDNNFQENKLNIVEIKHNVPKWFSYLRGSSNGVHFNDQIWFIAHTSCKYIPREYYNIFLVFDKDMNFIRHSTLFKFENGGIEFCMSLIIQPSNKVSIDKDNNIMNTVEFITSCSSWDRTSKIMKYSGNMIDKFINFYVKDDISQLNTINKSYCLVSAFFLNIKSNVHNIPYLEYGKKLLELDCNKVIFIDKKIYPFLKKYENSQTKLIPIVKEEIELWNELHDKYKDDKIENLDYLLYKYMKPYFISLALNKYKSENKIDNYIWVDFAVYKYFNNDNLKFISIMKSLPMPEKIWFRTGNLLEQKIIKSTVFGGSKDYILNLMNILNNIEDKINLELYSSIKKDHEKLFD